MYRQTGPLLGSDYLMEVFGPLSLLGEFVNWCLLGEWLIPVQIFSIWSDFNHKMLNLSKMLQMLKQNVKKKREIRLMNHF